jgi:tetratricopeptide (TPR) repeat protein
MKANLFKLTLVVSLLFFSSFVSFSQRLRTIPPGGNQKSSVIQYMGLVSVTITYNSPDVTDDAGNSRRGKIWGELVPYGLTDLGFAYRTPAPWRAGANENTTIEFSHDVMIEGQKLLAGTYGFHIIVNSEEWTLIFNKNYKSWGSYFYKEEEDALRVKIKPEKSPAYYEWLTYEFENRKLNTCTAVLLWEDIKAPFKIEVPNTMDIYLAHIRNELRGGEGFSWEVHADAVDFCLQNDTKNWEEALQWANNSIDPAYAGVRNFHTLSTKAAILEKLGKVSESEALMKEAIENPTALPFEIHAYGRKLLNEGKKEQALAAFELNFKRYNGAWPTKVGMMRGLSAMGDYKKALKFAEEALTQAPDDINKKSLTDAIQKLKSGKDMNK